MGKKGGTSSWFTAVKRAFRSPTKESDKKSSRQRIEDQHEQEEDDEKKREKRRWLFRKPTNQETVTQQLIITQTKERSTTTQNIPGSGGSIQADHAAAEEQRHAIAMEVATAAAAEAAAAVASRLIRPPTFNARVIYAAVVIQTAFRGYLARRALRALKGLVKLQALVRGHNVRKQAKMTLRCMQALVRVQARVLDQRVKLSQDGGSRKSTFSDNNSVLWESQYLQDISDRRSMSREGSSTADDWDERPHTIEEVKAMLRQRKEAALKREKTLSHAFSQQMLRNGRSSSMGDEDEAEDQPKWPDRWMATKPWERPQSKGRASTDNRDHIKTVEIDTSQPYSYLASNLQRTNHRNQYHQQYHQNQHQRPVSPSHRAHRNPYLHHSPVTPSPSKTRPIQVRSASPRCLREDRTDSTSQTPSLRSNYYYTGNVHQHSRGTTSSGTLPNYMAATESAKARARSQSAPRQRPSTPERERAGSAKKQLSFPVPEPNGVGTRYGNYGQNLRSPSFKSVAGSHLGLEQQSNYSSCHTESVGGEISPSSTSDLRRWLR